MPEASIEEQLSIALYALAEARDRAGRLLLDSNAVREENWRLKNENEELRFRNRALATDRMSTGVHRSASDDTIGVWVKVPVWALLQAYDPMDALRFHLQKLERQLHGFLKEKGLNIG